MRNKVLVPALLLLALSPLWTQRPAYGSCGGPLPPAEELRSSDAVFSGVATRVSGKRAIGPLVISRQSVLFEVRGAWKGVSSERVRVLGPDMYRDNEYPFEEGRSYLVYAYREGDELITNGCKGTKPLGEARADLRVLGSPDTQLAQGGPEGTGAFGVPVFPLIVALLVLAIITAGIVIRRMDTS